MREWRCRYNADVRWEHAWLTWRTMRGPGRAQSRHLQTRTAGSLYFEGLGRDGVFDAEPDFPVALAFYRDALRQAHASIDPPFDPPAGFRSDVQFPHARLQCWRTPDRFPHVWGGLDWLSEMLSRVEGGLPPLTEVEFH